MTDSVDREVDRLTLKQLDWFVAVAEAQRGHQDSGKDWLEWMVPPPALVSGYKPSTDDVAAGKIIDREKISTSLCVGGWQAWGRNTPEGDINPDGFGRTRKEAAMKAYVLLTFGETVKVPQELLR